MIVFRLLLTAALQAICLNVHAVQAVVPGQGTWETTLLARDLNQDGTVDAYYDTTQNLTWIADWGSGIEFNFSRSSNWSSTSVVFGVSGWRLPDAGKQSSSFLYSTGEVYKLVYETLGNTPADSDGKFTNNGPFKNAGGMWTGVNYDGPGYQPGVDAGLYFMFNQAMYIDERMPFDVLRTGVAVRDGDVSPVPEPSSLAMLFSGIGVVLALARRRNGTKSTN